MEFGAAFWVGVAFVVFVGLIAKPIGRVITAALDQRAARIRADLDEAATLRAQAEALLLEYQQKQRDVLEEARAILAHAEEEAARRLRAAEAEMELLAERKLQIAITRLASTEAAAVEHLRHQAVDIAAESVRAILANPAHQDWSEPLLDTAIGQIERVLQ